MTLFDRLPDCWQELGGRILPATRGNHSTRFLDQLREEALAPLWPDPEDPLMMNVSDAMPVRAGRTASDLSTISSRSPPHWQASTSRTCARCS